MLASETLLEIWCECRREVLSVQGVCSGENHELRAEPNRVFDGVEALEDGELRVATSFPELFDDASAANHLGDPAADRLPSSAVFAPE